MQDTQSLPAIDRSKLARHPGISTERARCQVCCADESPLCDGFACDACGCAAVSGSNLLEHRGNFSTSRFGVEPEAVGTRSVSFLLDLRPISIASRLVGRSFWSSLCTSDLRCAMVGEHWAAGAGKQLGCFGRVAVGVRHVRSGRFPLAAGIVRRWIPQHRRGVANSVVAVGGRLGGALAPIITIQLMMMWTYGGAWISQPTDAAPAASSWRPVVLLYGLIGVVIAIVFFKLFRDHPAEQPQVNDAELAIIGVSRQQHAIDSVAARGQANFPPIALMCMCPSLWLNSFLQFASNFGWAFLVTSMPKYLEDVHKTTATAQGWLQSLPLACGIVGMLLGGILLDRASRRFGLRIGRAMMLSVPRVIVGLAFLVVLLSATRYKRRFFLRLSAWQRI